MTKIRLDTLSAAMWAKRIFLQKYAAIRDQDETNVDQDKVKQRHFCSIFGDLYCVLKTSTQTSLTGREAHF